MAKKSKGADTSSEPISIPVDMKRLRNIGNEVVIKYADSSLPPKTVRVKEPSLEVLIEYGEKIIGAQELFQSYSGLNDAQVLVSMLKSEEGFDLIKSIASALTGEPSDTFKDVSLSSWIRLIAVTKEVIHWEELQENFTILMEGLMTDLPVK